MKTLRVIGVTLATPTIAAAPYFLFLGIATTSGAKEGGAPAQGMLFIGVLLAIGTVLGWIFLGLARIRWKNRSMIERSLLHAWGPSLAALAGLMACIPFVFTGVWSAVWEIIAAAGVCALIGYYSTRLWERYAYPNPEPNQAVDPTRGARGSP